MVGEILLHQQSLGEWWWFEQPLQIFSAESIDIIPALLDQIEEMVNKQGLYAVGFLSYEAASAFDEALITHRPNSSLPLLWFGLYNAPQRMKGDPLIEKARYTIGRWQPAIDPDSFYAHIATIKAEIARGNTYQVNYTFPLHTTFSGSARGFFQTLHQTQQGAYSAFIDGGAWAVCSASPELFFTLDGDRVVTRPMKGTRKRGLTWQQDQEERLLLQQSEKDRAENVMIVDMIRNDLGHISKLGTVRVPTLFEISGYPTLLQMTSTITAESSASWAQIMAALFPCASITGAPKVRTMALINQLEQEPRGVYTGCIGYLAPQRQAQFNVAIRTMTIDLDRGSAEYHVGSGIVWDSDPTDEYQECLLKAAILTTDLPPFALLESLGWRDGRYVLLEEHLNRLAQSADYWNYRFDRERVLQALIDHAHSLTEMSKVRLQLSADGEITIDSAPLVLSDLPVRLGLAIRPIDSRHRALYHKTSWRTVYETAKATRPECDDVVLWNERGEITETATANIVFLIAGEWVTPPVESGLLAGTLRAHLLQKGALVEKVVTVDQAQKATKIAVINSVRGWRSAEWSED